MKTQEHGGYYPSRQKTGALHDDFRLLFDHVYRLQRQLDEHKDKLAGMTKEVAKSDPGGPSTTKIMGLNVAGTPPANGQKLTYNASTGQIEWQ